MMVPPRQGWRRPSLREPVGPRIWRVSRPGACPCPSRGRCRARARDGAGPRRRAGRYCGIGSGSLIDWSVGQLVCSWDKATSPLGWVLTLSARLSRESSGSAVGELGEPPVGVTSTGLSYPWKSTSRRRSSNLGPTGLPGVPRRRRRRAVSPEVGNDEGTNVFRFLRPPSVLRLSGEGTRPPRPPLLRRRRSQDEPRQAMSRRARPGPRGRARRT